MVEHHHILDANESRKAAASNRQQNVMENDSSKYYQSLKRGRLYL